MGDKAMRVELIPLPSHNTAIFTQVPGKRLSEKSLGDLSRTLTNRRNGAKKPFLGPRVGKKYGRDATPTIFQTVSVGEFSEVHIQHPA
jgi:hypothetical protein